MTTALVTGASSGMGKATAKQLLADGYTVYAAARRLEKMEDLKALGARTLKMDITTEEDVQAVVQTITEEAGGVDVLVNNAGFAVYGPMEDVSPEEAHYQFEVNVFGLARITQLVLPYMREKKAGKIVNISSMGGKIYTPLGSWYHATKHALEGWSDCLRLEVKPFGIDVIIIEPGGVDSEFGGVAFEPMVERAQNGSAYAPMIKSMTDMMENMGDRAGGSPPEVIAETISKALKARTPRTRYVAGSMARPLMMLRRWGGDRLYDRAIMRMFS